MDSLKAPTATEGPSHCWGPAEGLHLIVYTFPVNFPEIDLLFSYSKHWKIQILSVGFRSLFEHPPHHLRFRPKECSASPSRHLPLPSQAVHMSRGGDVSSPSSVSKGLTDLLWLRAACPSDFTPIVTSGSLSLCPLSSVVLVLFLHIGNVNE